MKSEVIRSLMNVSVFLLTVLVFHGPSLFALVIGNGAYTNITWLNNPVNDANDMAAALQSLRFQVDTVLNGSLDQMENAVIRLKNRLSTNGNAYGFFFTPGTGYSPMGRTI